MSKKHFIALANMLITARMGHSGPRGNVSINPFKEEHIAFLADWCQSQNPRFNRLRWLAYILQASVGRMTAHASFQRLLHPRTWGRL